MSCNCKNKQYCKCGEGGSSSSSAEIASLQDQLDEIASAVKFLTCGHPVIVVDDPDDIATFNLTTGWGSNCWEGFAICNGTTYTSPKGNIVTTFNYIDRFIVGALGNYNVGDTGGSDSVVLTIPNLPIHDHGVTDGGHTHVVIDPGHDHNVTDPGHIHGGTGTPHTHTGTTATSGAHTHGFTSYNASGSTCATVPIGLPGQCSTIGDNAETTTSAGSHTHAFTTDPTSAGITVSAAFTGIDMDDAFTGISNTPNTTGISINNTGSDTAHENRPPYLAVLFVKKIY